MRMVEAEEGMMLVVRDEHRGRVTSPARAKCEVVGKLRGGWLTVRVVETFFGRPGCLKYAQSADAKVQSRFCFPWSEGVERGIKEVQERGEQARRKRTVVENLAAMIELGTVAPNGRVFFEYDEMVTLGRRLGLDFATAEELAERA